MVAVADVGTTENGHPIQAPQRILRNVVPCCIASRTAESYARIAYINLQKAELLAIFEFVQLELLSLVNSSSIRAAQYELNFRPNLALNLSHIRCEILGDLSRFCELLSTMNPMS